MLHRLHLFDPQRFDRLCPAHKWRAHDNRSGWWVRAAVSPLINAPFYCFVQDVFVQTDSFMFTFQTLPFFSTHTQLAVSLERQQEEASLHSEAGSRLPRRLRAGAASLGGFSRGPSELWYRRLRCLWLWESSSQAFYLLGRDHSDSTLSFKSFYSHFSEVICCGCNKYFSTHVGF